MSVSTSNVYGKISISDAAIAKVAKNATLECYGIVETVSRRFTDSLTELIRKQPGGRGIKVVTSGDRIFIDIYVIIKYGVSSPLKRPWKPRRKFPENGLRSSRSFPLRRTAT